MSSEISVARPATLLATQKVLRCQSDPTGNVTGNAVANDVANRAGITLSEYMPEGFAPKGVHGRLVQLLRRLDTESENGLIVVEHQVRLSADVLKLRALALRGGVSSPSTAGEWLAKWRATSMLHPTEPIVFLDVVSGSAVLPLLDHPKTATTINSATELDVVLTHLAEAHRHNETSLIDHLDALANRLIDSVRPRGSETGIRAANRSVNRADPARFTEQSEVGSSFVTTKEELLPTSTPAPRGTNPNATARTRTEIESLMKPLTDVCRSMNLPAMSDPTGVGDAIACYTDQQVTQAVRLFLIDVRADTGIKSPVGVFVKRARTIDHPYFDLPTEAPTLVVDDTLAIGELQTSPGPSRTEGLAIGLENMRRIRNQRKDDGPSSVAS